ncbi:hypothetical protein AKO1_011949 [Acrasis kona]|uniref:Aquaporin n=1 Tax=Acrasis kona TaxID=1008807 RepID=A0AAW2ZA62_9EUKA
MHQEDVGPSIASQMFRKISNNPDVSFKWRAIVSEFIGTAFYVFLGAMCQIVAAPNGVRTQLGNIIIALGHAFALVGVTHTFYPISGAHINPVVTISTIVTRNIGVIPGILYISAQLLGGILAAALVLLFAGSDSHLGSFETNDQWRAFGLEITLTYILMTVYLGSTIRSQFLKEDSGLEPVTYLFAHIPVGLIIGSCQLAGPLSGACLNPARVFGPELVSWNFKTYSWIYYTGPVVGGVLASLTFEFVLWTKPQHQTYLSLNRS